MATTPAFSIVPPYTPELLPAVQLYIKTYLSKIDKSSVVELGSGYSTIWFAQLSNVVYSYEHDKDWYNEVRLVLLDNNLINKTIRCFTVPDNLSTAIERIKNDSIDLVLVDCIDEKRKECALVAMNKLKSGGLLIIDDSHWDELKTLEETLKDWKSIEFQGQHERKTGEVKYHQTTVYTKP